MNDMTTVPEKTTTTRTYYVQSVAGGSPRLIRAKSSAAVRDFLVAETWTAPRPATVDDMALAMQGGAGRLEKA